jgi:phenylpropionate dioxygenase-like ring-hydroxylating dioxygenase large terminal subunit
MTGARDVAEQSTDGSAYGRPAAQSNKRLTEIGPGTGLGELMRRYWHPIAGAAEVTTTPRKIRILGEDLVLFRDRKGRPGLLYPRCMHRGTTLYYGKVEDEGIRCCYHGWLFDVEGNCLDMPCEPKGGLRRDRARQPWYPVQEQYGLVFAYLGPPAKKPVLPRYDILENLEPGEQLAYCIGGRATTGDDSVDVVPYSWLHMCDNIMDPYHVYVLHSTFTDAQFHPDFAVMPKRVDFFNADHGVCYAALRDMPDGRAYERVSTYLLPNIMSVPPTFDLKESRSIAISWVVPVDDDKYFQVMLERCRVSRFTQPRRDPKGRSWAERTEAERREWPDDYEAQAGQGPISLHSEEHLVSSDRGIVLQRRLLQQQIDVVASGGDPLGVTFDPAQAVVTIRSGNFYRVPEAAD